MTDEPVFSHAAIHWAWSSIEQLDRPGEATRYIVEQCKNDPFFAGTTHEKRILFFRLDAERHFLLTAVRNLDRALEGLNVSVELSSKVKKDAKILRDAHEHWDQAKDALTKSGIDGKAFRQFEAKYPGSNPMSYKFSNEGEFMLGNALTSTDLRSAVEDVLTELLRMEAAGEF